MIGITSAMYWVHLRARPLLLLFLLGAVKACTHGHTARTRQHPWERFAAINGRSRSLLSFKSRRCATETVSFKYRRRLEQQHTALAVQEAAALKSARLGINAAEEQQSITIPVHVQVVSVVDPSGIGFGDVSDAVVKQQITALNAAYATAVDSASTKVQFEVSNITRSSTPPEEDMCNIKTEAKLKAKLRTGNAGTLNLYITDLSPCGVYGWSSWPWDIQKKGLEADGVVVHYDTLPGGTALNYNRGATAIHEIGHWLGLYHTFENGCKHPGDSVGDTPYCEAPVGESCPSSPRDSCPTKPGTDPTDNYMSYSYDACLNTFTPGQLKRIERIWNLYRRQ